MFRFKYPLTILTDNKSISKRSKFRSMGLCLLFTVLGILGCKNVDKKSPSMVFHYNEDESVTTLDPAYVKSQSEIWIVSQIFNGLVDLNAQLQVVPALSDHWEISEDKKIYTFHLRRDAQFCFPDFGGKVTHRRVNSRDCAFSLSRIADPKSASPGAWIFADKIDSNLSQVFVPLNDTIFQIHLLRPVASLLNLLATNYGFIVPIEYKSTEKSVLARNPIGTGPFYLKRWEEQIKLVLRKNDVYHEKDSAGISLPYLDAIDVSFVKNKQTAFMQFLAGSYDFFNGLESSFKDELLTTDAQLKPKYNERLNTLITPFLNTEYIGCYLGDQPGKVNYLQDVHLRRALELSVDRKAIVRFFRNGLGTPGEYGFVPPQLNPNQIKVLTDSNTPSKQDAKAEFALSDYSKMKGKPVITLSTTADYLDMMVYLQEAWSRLGINIKVDIQTGGMLRQLRNEGKLMLFRGSWIADYPDAENYLACFYQNFLSPNGPNYTHLVDADFDALYEAIESGESKDRLDDIFRANLRLMSQVPVIPLYYDKSIRLMHPWVKGLGNDVTNRLPLKRVKIAK
ncbi:MAG: peptide ABC transporter substrate-binding protein [Bacteroidetes bacterium]|nr:peptide ABC transporter substrate-binding protein [Bacteroidota bacterium]MDA1224976.1 peptide ABC transporter substrate-binding protein [Bacteroidota bacterium]